MISKPSSRDVSYYHEKQYKQNRSTIDQGIMKEFINGDKNKYSLPTELHTLEQYFMNNFSDENIGVFKSIMKPTNEKESLKQLELNQITSRDN